MNKRDPRIDPREGDVLRRKSGCHELLVDMVRDGWVYYRMIDGAGRLIAVRAMTLENWRVVKKRRWRTAKEENDNGNIT